MTNLRKDIEEVLDNRDLTNRKMILDQLEELFKKEMLGIIGEDESQTKFGAIRCARCKRVPDMPHEKHCTDWVNQAKQEMRDKLK